MKQVRSKSVPITVGLVVALPVLLFAGICLDRVLTRAGRIHFAQQQNNLVSVYDQILRYEYENLALPRALSDLVPEYLRDEQIASQGTPLYRYDKDRRTVSLAAGVTLRGLFTRTLSPAIMLLPDPAEHVRASGVRPVAEHALAPSGPEGKLPPRDAMVFEAEHYTELNYGWELHADPACGGGAYAYSKEGTGNGPGQIGSGVYNFYDIHEGKEFALIRWHFRMAKAGTYYIYGRIWTTGSHCSNCIIVGIDRAGPRSNRKGYYGTDMANKKPFRWLWTPAKNGPVAISAGDHVLEAYLHEDGVQVDQWALTPVELTGDAVFASSAPVNQGTAFRQQAGPPVAIAFDLKSMVMTRDTKPECHLTIRKLRPADGKAFVDLRLEHAGPGGADLQLGRHVLDFAGSEELLFFPIDFSRLDFSTLGRREYLLVAEVTRARTIMARAHVTLMHPFRWEVRGPFPLIRNGQHGPLDGDAESSSNDEQTGTWTAFKDSSFDHYGVLDFGLQAIGNSLHAPQNVTVYAQTEIDVPESKEYLLKIQSDDQMLLWIDGMLVYRHDSRGPVTRAVKRLKLPLERGRHRVRIRVNQWRHSSYGDGRWQASLRFRTADDGLSHVTGR